MRHVPEPGRDEWVARMRERARLDAEELIPRPPFVVFGLAEPRLRPAALADAGQVNGAWDSIGLAYGAFDEPAGPWVMVTTAVRGTGESDRDVEADLWRAIDHERDRIAAQAGIDEDDPDERPDYSRTVLAIGTEEVSGILGLQGNVWAVRVLAAAVRVTVVGRGADPRAVGLEPVADLAPYLQGRSERLGHLAERQRQQPAPVLEPAEGIAAYRALAEAALASQARLLESLQAGRLPRHRAGEGATMHALWQRAVREQARISGIDDREANEIVTLLVNHLTELQDKAPWFTAEPRLREAAIEETLRHGVLGEDVASKPAQQAWARCWAHDMFIAGQESGAALRADREVGGTLRTAWLQAWAAWARTS
jgi:hypothetical protein